MKEILLIILPPAISLIGVIITIVATNKRSNNKVIAELKSRSESSDAKLDKEIALLRAEVDELMREVRLHNNFAQRMPAVEADIKNMKEQITELKERGA